MIYRHDFGSQTGAAPSKCNEKCESALLVAATLLVGFSPAPALSEPEVQETKIVQMTTRQFMDLPQEDFARLLPDLVVSPLISDSYDALEFASRLQEFGYQGHYRVIVRDLPDTQLVSQEIRMAAPAINFDVVKLAAQQRG